MRPSPRTRRSRIAQVLLLAGLPLSLAACGDAGAPGILPSVSLVEVAPDSAVVDIGDTVRFVATTKSPTGVVTSPALATWKSSSPEIATISSSGVVTALRSGETVIQASVGLVSRSAVVRVSSRVALGRAGCRAPNVDPLAGTTLDVVVDTLSVPAGWSAPVAVCTDGLRNLVEPAASVTVETDDSTVASPAHGAIPGVWSVAGRRNGSTTFRVRLNDRLIARGVITVQPLARRLTVALRHQDAGTARLESWSLACTPDQVLLAGEIPGDAESSLRLMNAGLDWSPDGNDLLYSSSGQAFVLLSRVGAPAWRYVAPEGVYTPNWAPDGTILFSTRVGGLRRVAARQATLLPPPAITEPAWHARLSFDNRLLYACEMELPYSPYGDGSVCLLTEGVRTRLTSCGFNPDWSPDGASVVTLCGAVSVHTLGASSRPFTDHYLLPANSARWSPDGTSLALVAHGHVLWLAAADASRPVYRSTTSEWWLDAVAWER